MAGRGISLSTKGAGPGSGRDEKWCRPCDLDLGEKRKAHRIMAKGGGRCEEHYRYESGQPQRTPEAQAFIERWKRVVSTRPRDLDGADIVSSEHGSVSPQPDFVSDEEEEQPMGRQGRKLDIVVLAEIRKDSEAGMSINAIATKHGVSWPTVKSVLGGGKNGTAKNGAAKNGHTTKNGRAAASTPTNGATSVQVGVELLDRIWATLAPEKKAELLSAM